MKITLKQLKRVIREQYLDETRPPSTREEDYKDESEEERIQRIADRQDAEDFGHGYHLHRRNQPKKEAISVIDHKYEVYLFGIDWDTEGFEDPTLPENFHTEIMARDIKEAYTRAMEQASDDSGFLINGVKSSRIIQINNEEIKRTYPTLKEAFLKEEQDANPSYLNSIALQMRLARTPTSIRQVAATHDKILLMLGQPEKVQQGTLQQEEPFLKFHFRLAKKDVASGKLDPLKAPTGTALYKQEIARRKAIPKPEPKPQKELSPEEKHKAEVDAAYGSPDRPPWGLGS